MDDYEVAELTPSEIPGLCDRLIEIEKGVVAEEWDHSHFLVSRPGKWKLSFCLKRHGEVVAFAICSQKDDSLHVHRFAVAEGVRRQGVGSLMMREVERRATKELLHQIVLKVNVLNDAAKRFYERNGLVCVSEVQNSSLTGYNYVMCKELGPHVPASEVKE